MQDTFWNNLQSQMIQKSSRATMSLEANQFHLAERMVEQIVTRSNSLSIDRETKQRLTMKLL